MHSKTANYCEICFESLNSRKELQQHYKDKHVVSNENSTDRLNIIPNCDKITAFKAIRSSNQNEQKHSSISTPTTTIISKSFDNTEQSLASSTLDNDNSNSSKGNNEENDKTDSDDLYVINNKVETKVQKNELIRGLLDRKHQCKWCAQRFYTKSQLRQHESTHTNTVLYCPVCDKEFTHKDRLAGHMKCHMEPSLECKVCGKKFKRLCNLYNHELVHGLTEHAFMLCQFCGRGFRSRRDYQNHVIANHRDQLMKSEIIKNSNNILNDSFSVSATSSSILGEELKNNNMSDSITNNKSLRIGATNNENLSDFFSPLKNRNDFQNNNSFLENENDNEDKIDGIREFKKNKQNHDKFNNNNTQLLVKAAEFVDNNGDKKHTL
jgi:hypothetical protein